MNGKTLVAGGSGRAAETVNREIGNLWAHLRDRATASGGKNPMRLGFCACAPKAGTTTVAANAALFFGTQGRSTVLLEGNTARPSLASRFGVSVRPGLHEYLLGKATAAAVRHRVASGLEVVPASRYCGDRLALMDRDALSGSLDALATGSDLLLVDLPPVLTAFETRFLAPQVGAIVLIVEADRTQPAAVSRALAELAQSGATVIGTVLNKARYPVPSRLQRLLLGG
jgi:Mrp family chromosome partitioning ATPase